MYIDEHGDGPGVAQEVKAMTEVITPASLIRREDIVRIADKWRAKRGSLVMMLHEIQNELGYVPRSVALDLSHEIDVPLARIYEVLTFYSYFRLHPPGKYNLSVCIGTACYLKGGKDILDQIKTSLDIQEGETTPDGLFHLEAVRCLGCCGLAPVMSINETIHGNVRKRDVVDLLSQYREGSDRND